jgi:SAM-dependent methyltransferase
MSSDAFKTTVQAYDEYASQFAQHFQGYAEEKFNEVNQAFELIGGPKRARVIEIGCGTGMHAKYIVKKVGWYEGFDPSEGMLQVARKEIPGVSFVKADALTYKYPKNLDAVFAFASLLHVGKEDFKEVCRKVSDALRPGGVFCMTLKEAGEYREAMQQDDFGARLFYYYNPQLASEIAGPDFDLVFEDHLVLGSKGTAWCSVILRKKGKLAGAIIGL